MKKRNRNMSSSWFYEINGKRHGPISFRSLKVLAATNRLKPADLVWQDDTSTKCVASSIDGLFDELPQVEKRAPASLPPPQSSVTGGSGQISLVCSGCGFQFKVAEEFAGREGRCPIPTCGKTYTVPQPSAGILMSSAEKSAIDTPAPSESRLLKLAAGAAKRLMIVLKKAITLATKNVQLMNLAWSLNWADEAAGRKAHEHQVEEQLFSEIYGRIGVIDDGLATNRKVAPTPTKKSMIDTAKWMAFEVQKKAAVTVLLSKRKSCLRELGAKLRSNRESPDAQILHEELNYSRSIQSKFESLKEEIASLSRETPGLLKKVMVASALAGVLLIACFGYGFSLSTNPGGELQSQSLVDPTDSQSNNDGKGESEMAHTETSTNAPSLSAAGKHTGQIGIEVARKQGQIVIKSLILGSPAQAKGIQLGDRLLGIGRTRGAIIDTTGKTEEQVMNLLRGEAGQRVWLRYHPLYAADPAEVEIARRERYTETKALTINWRETGYSTILPREFIEQFPGSPRKYVYFDNMSRLLAFRDEIGDERIAVVTELLFPVVGGEKLDFRMFKNIDSPVATVERQSFPKFFERVVNNDPTKNKWVIMHVHLLRRVNFVEEIMFLDIQAPDCCRTLILDQIDIGQSQSLIDSTDLNPAPKGNEKVDHAAAVKDFDESIQLDPKDATTYTSRGIALVGKGDHNAAIKDFTEAIRRNPKDDTAYTFRGLAWGLKGDYDAAIKDYNEAIRLKPKDSPAYVGRGGAWNNKREFDAAIKDFTEAIRLDPKLAVAYSNRGLSWQSKGDFDACIKDCTDAIRIDPKLGAAYNNRGLSWLGKAEFATAIKDYSEAIRLDPKNAVAYGNRGEAWRSKGDFDAAIKDCTDAIRLDPKLAMAYSNRGFSWLSKADFDAAIKDCTEAIRLDPKLAMAYDNRGYAWLSKGNFDAAVKDFTEAIRINPKLASTYSNRGAAWFAKRDFDAAIKDCTEAIRLDPKLAMAYGNRGYAWLSKGNFDAAVKDFTEAIRLNPNEQEYKKSLESALKRKKERP